MITRCKEFYYYCPRNNISRVLSRMAELCFVLHWKLGGLKKWHGEIGLRFNPGTAMCGIVWEQHQSVLSFFLFFFLSIKNKNTRICHFMLYTHKYLTAWEYVKGLWNDGSAPFKSHQYFTCTSGRSRFSIFCVSSQGHKVLHYRRGSFISPELESDTLKWRYRSPVKLCTATWYILIYLSHFLKCLYLATQLLLDQKGFMSDQ